MNPLELLADPLVSDILIDGTKAILVDRNNQLAETSLCFTTEYDCVEFAKSLLGDERLDLSKPYAEANRESEYGRLRIHAILGGECSERTQIAIRRHPKNKLTLSELQNLNFFDEAQKNYLQEIVQTKRNFVILGATGSGKTTLLRAMLDECSSERVISIEESFELNLVGNCVALQTRTNNQEGKGEITLSDLVRQSLRMRPDRIVIGEARGDELKVLLTALNTGHQGSGFTLHANSTRELIPRLQALLALGGLTFDVASQLIETAIDVAIEVSRVDGIRKVIAIKDLRGQHE